MVHSTSDDPPLVEAEAMMEEGRLMVETEASPTIVTIPATLTSEHDTCAVAAYPVHSLDSALTNTFTKRSEPRPALLSALVHKEDSPANKKYHGLGLLLNETDNGTTRISHIDPKGPLAMTLFRAGDRIISINNISCEDKHEAFVCGLLSGIENDAAVLIVVENDSSDRAPNWVATTIPKPRDEKMGIKMRLHRHGDFRITHIDEDRVLASSLLNIGDTLESINGVPCNATSTSEDILLLLKQDVEYITFVTKTQQGTGCVLSRYRSSISLGADTETSRHSQIATRGFESPCPIQALVVVIVLIVIIILVSIILRFNNAE
jgi:hypothetical protein